MLRQDENSEPTSMSEDTVTPQCDLHKETSNGTANRHNLAPISATQTRIACYAYLAIAEHNIARRRTQHAVSQATRTAKTSTHAMATASAASSATAPAPVTQTEHDAVISDDLGQGTNLCDLCEVLYLIKNCWNTDLHCNAAQRWVFVVCVFTP